MWYFWGLGFNNVDGFFFFFFLCMVFPKESVSSIKAVIHILFTGAPKLRLAKLQWSHKPQKLKRAKLHPHCQKRCPLPPSAQMDALWEQGNTWVQSFQGCLFAEDFLHPWFTCVRSSVSRFLHPSYCLIHKIQVNWLFPLLPKAR